MITRISPPDIKALAFAKEEIARGGVVAFHTETVYGLGANAFDGGAVAHIFALKGRPADNPLIVHVHRDYDLSALVDDIPPYAKALARAFLPGPLTMVYPSVGKVSPLVSCGLNTLAVRVPSSETAQAFLRTVGLPIAAPSANKSKHVSPVTARHVYDDFQGEIPLILDGGACSGGIESTVLDCTGDVPQILRAGLVTREMIESVAGKCAVYRMRTGEKPKSPGMAHQHYAPKCRTVCFSAEEFEKARLCYEQELRAGGTPFYVCERALLPFLSGNALDLGGDPAEMAARLYAVLREGEQKATLLIAIEPKERGGVMDGVLNRFCRAFGRDHET